MTHEDANNNVGSAGNSFNSVSKEYPGPGAGYVAADFHSTGGT